MPRPLDPSEIALWKQRFRSPRLRSVELASANPSRGLIVTNHRSHTFELRFVYDLLNRKGTTHADR